MPDTTQIVRLRRKESEKKNRSPLGKSGILVSGCLSLGFVFIILILAFIYSYLTEGIPSIEELPRLLEPPDGLLLQPTRLYDRSGVHILASLENAAVENRQYLELNPLFKVTPNSVNSSNTLPNSLVLVTVATMDPSFWDNPGYTIESLLSNAHPTISQHLVSDLLLWNKPSGLKRAVQERILAAQVIRRFGRQKILEWYLNTVKYGRLIYGADAAAHAFFGKSAVDLSLAEAAVIAASAEVPSVNPLTSPGAARARGQDVLLTLLNTHQISQDEFLAADTQKLVFQTPTSEDKDLSPAITHVILDQLSSRYDLERIERGGFRVITTVDYDLQIQSMCTLKTQLRRMEGDYRELKTTDNTDCAAARLLPTSPTNQSQISNKVSASAVILDPHNGELLALADTGLQRDRQTGVLEDTFDNLMSLEDHTAGSILTPFIYLAGFTRGFSPASLVWDIPTSNDEIVSNESNSQFHGPVRLRIALANDYLIPAQQVSDQVGIENILKISNQMGLNISKTESTAPKTTVTSPENLLSDGQVDLLSLVQAYGVLANQGNLVGHSLPNVGDDSKISNLTPITTIRLEDYAGRIWSAVSSTNNDQEIVDRPVISPQIAYLITNILSDESAAWPTLGHPNALEIGKPAATKIGSTVEGNDIWTIGYTPQFVVGIWIGQSNQIQASPLSKNFAAGVWHSLMQYTTRNTSAEGWNLPPGVEMVNVCDPSGLLPTADCPSVVSEVFLTENVPTQTDTLYKRLQINRETGRLATVFTPQEFIENRVYMLVPPEAREWASKSGLPIPPETYDVIQTSSKSINPNVEINDPPMLSFIKGSIKVQGTAAGEGFGFYRLRVGKGLYPDVWLDITAQNNTPVSSGILGSWDTLGLSGLYSIQLMVVRQDQSVDTYIVQVTIDNNAPSIELIYPSQDQIISLSQNGVVTLQVKAVDDLGIKLITLNIDGKDVANLTQPPYAFQWQASIGRHKYLVKAVDLAGNTTEQEINFIVK